MGLLLEVVGLVVALIALAVLWGWVMRAPSLERALNCASSDSFTLCEDDGTYERIIGIKPTVVMKGQETTVAYVSSQFRPGELRESMHVRVRGYRGPLNIFYTDGLPERIAGVFVKFEVLQDEKLSQMRAAQLLQIVRSWAERREMLATR